MDISNISTFGFIWELFQVYLIPAGIAVWEVESRVSGLMLGWRWVKKHSVNCHPGDLGVLFLEEGKREVARRENRLLTSALWTGLAVGRVMPVRENEQMCSGCTEEARVNEPDAKEQIYRSLEHFEKLEGWGFQLARPFILDRFLFQPGEVVLALMSQEFGGMAHQIGG